MYEKPRSDMDWSHCTMPTKIHTTNQPEPQYISGSEDSDEEMRQRNSRRKSVRNRHAERDPSSEEKCLWHDLVKI